MRSPQAIAVAVALVIGVLLFIAPRIPSSESKVGSETESISAPSIWEKELASLAPQEKEQVEQWMNDLQLDSVRSYFGMRHRPFALGAMQLLIADKSSKLEDWLLAGKDFYRAAMMMPPDQRSEAYSLAIYAYDKVLDKEPKHREARLKKGICLVEQRQDPMKGVTLLRELVAEDSTNIDAQLQLGFFSMQSSQWDKAESRFKTVLSIDSNYIDAWLYLGQAQELQGNKEGAIAHYEKYQSLVTDTVIREEVRKYIDKLKTVKTN